MPAQFPALQQRGLAKFIKLALDFSANEVLDPRITFSRTSNATRTNAQGLIEYAPHNLLTNSENFDNAAWSKVTCSVLTNTVNSPDGTATADKIVEGTGSVNPYITQSISVNTSATYTFSCYAKQDSLSQKRYLMLLFPSTNFGANVRILVDLSNGSKTEINSPIAASVTSIGNQWYRISVTATAVVTGTAGLQIRITSQVDGSLAAYTGDGTSGIYIWGAQLNIDSLQPYYTTSVKNLLGYSQNFENAAWTKSNSSVLTNLLTYSQEFDNVVWVKTNATVTANSIVAPDGATTGDTVLAVATGGDTGIRYTTAQSNSTVYTASIYAKYTNTRYLVIRNLAIGATLGEQWTFFDLLNGTVGTKPANVTAVITPVGGGWYRCSVSATTLATIINNFLDYRLSTTDNAYSVLNTSTINIWGAQLVQGTNPEEYTVTTSATAPIQVMGPLGFVGAEKLVEDTTNGQHYINTYTATIGATYSISFYAKNGGRSKLLVSGFGLLGQGYNPIFDLEALTVSNAPPNATVQNVGNGWRRCSLTVTATGSSGLFIYLYTNSNSYIGDGTSGVYIFGAQLSDSASLDPYSYNFGAAPTSTAYYGPRFDYDPVTLAPKGLLIEESRTNLLTYSEQFDNASWAKSNATITANVITAPDGALTGDNLISNAGAVGYVYGATPTSFLVGTSYTLSIYAKAGERTSITLLAYGTYFGGGSNKATTFNLSNGTFANAGGSISPDAVSMASVGNGWYRCAVTVACTTATTGAPYQIRSSEISGDGTSGIYIWGAQLEAGAFPTSYIPTTSAQVTRTADNASMVGTNFSSWYNQSEGTVATEYDIILNTGNRVIFNIGANGTFNTTAYGVQTNTYIGLLPGSTPVNMTSTVDTTTLVNKIAAGLQTNNSTISVNTVLGTTDTSCNMPESATTLTLGCSQFGGVFGNFLNGHIKSFKFFSKRFINTYLQSLTQ